MLVQSPFLVLETIALVLVGFYLIYVYIVYEHECKPWDQTTQKPSHSLNRTQAMTITAEDSPTKNQNSSRNGTQATDIMEDESCTRCDDKMHAECQSTASECALGEQPEDSNDQNETFRQSVLQGMHEMRSAIETVKVTVDETNGDRKTIAAQLFEVTSVLSNNHNETFRQPILQSLHELSAEVGMVKVTVDETTRDKMAMAAQLSEVTSALHDMRTELSNISIAQTKQVPGIDAREIMKIFQDALEAKAEDKAKLEDRIEKLENAAAPASTKPTKKQTKKEQSEVNSKNDETAKIIKDLQTANHNIRAATTAQATSNFETVSLLHQKISELELKCADGEADQQRKAADDGRTIRSLQLENEQVSAKAGELAYKNRQLQVRISNFTNETNRKASVHEHTEKKLHDKETELMHSNNQLAQKDAQVGNLETQIQDLNTKLTDNHSNIRSKRTQIGQLILDKERLHTDIQLLVARLEHKGYHMEEVTRKLKNTARKFLKERDEWRDLALELMSKLHKLEKVHASADGKSEPSEASDTGKEHPATASTTGKATARDDKGQQGSSAPDSEAHQDDGPDAAGNPANVDAENEKTHVPNTTKERPTEDSGTGKADHSSQSPPADDIESSAGSTIPEPSRSDLDEAEIERLRRLIENKAYREVLEIDLTEELTERMIVRGYKAVSLKYHPDRNFGHEEAANAKFRFCKDAKDELEKSLVSDEELEAQKEAQRDAEREEELQARRKKAQGSRGGTIGSKWADL